MHDNDAVQSTTFPPYSNFSMILCIISCIEALVLRNSNQYPSLETHVGNVPAIWIFAT